LWITWLKTGGINLQFNIKQKEFYAGLNIVKKAVASSNTLPILTGIYLKAVTGKGLQVKATDLELGIEYWIDVDIQREGAVVLPANQLINIIRELPNEQISFKVNQEKWQAELNCLSSQFKLSGYDPDEFPSLPEVDIPVTFKMPANKLLDTIKKVRVSTSSDETQPALTGALFEVKPEKIRMVSTNTYRLSFIELNYKTGIEDDIKAIIPGNTLQELSSLLNNDGEVEILINENYARFDFEGIIVISRLIEGKFPNYELVIPDEFNSDFVADLKRMQNSVKRASLIARLDSNIISLIVNEDKLEINSLENSSGYAHEEVEIELNGSEQNINIDAGYLLDVLKILSDEEIHVELIGPLNPLVIKSVAEASKFIYLIMPVRSQN